MASGRKPKTRAAQLSWTWGYWQDRTMTFALYSERDAVIEHSYAAFVRGEAYTDDIRMADDGVRLRHGSDDESEPDTLSEAWDEWLARHPEQRAEWDTEPRRPRLKALEAQHVLHPRPFTAESIVANPAWYRRLYGILGMSDEEFDTVLSALQLVVSGESSTAPGAPNAAKTRGSRAQQAKPAASREPQVALMLPEGVRFEVPSRLVELSRRRGGHVRAVVYCRTADPEDPFLTKQMHAAWQYCVERGYRIEQTLTDTAVPPKLTWSPKELIEREGVDAYLARMEKEPPSYPGLDAARELIKQRRADILVVFSPDRLVSKKESLAMVIDGMPPTAFVEMWQVSDVN